VANLPQVRSIVFGSGLVFFGLIIAQLVLVFMISARIHRMRPQRPRFCSCCIRR
jgi:FtsH-binding integral membrane protein